MQFEVERLVCWFLEHRRDLPWRADPCAYSVWISEVMLQQTQASVVQGYFLRWMQRFPSIRALANASLEEVIKVWEGLGYYSRARHLHAAAQQIVKEHGGQLPSSYEALIQIKGLGPYTVGAILSFGFKQRFAAVDGNAIRVLSRYFAVQEDVSVSKTLKHLWHVATEILPQEQPWLVVEGIIELGALVCKKEPLCSQCPLQDSCQARGQGIERQLPYKSRKTAITPLERDVFVITSQEKILIRKGPPGKLMADLYHFPFKERTEKSEFPLPDMQFVTSFDAVTHHFTRFRALLYPSVWTLDQPKQMPEYQWVEIKQLSHYPFSAGHRKILNAFRTYYDHLTH